MTVRNFPGIFAVCFLMILSPSLALAIDPGDIEDPDFFYYDYSARDYEVVDYQQFALPGVDI